MSGIQSAAMTGEPPAATPAADELAAWQYRSPAWKSPALFVVTAIVWVAALAWFHPRLWSLVGLADSWWGKGSVAYFVLFAELAWLYGVYNVAIVCFAALYRWRDRSEFLDARAAMLSAPTSTPVAVLYTTCNDFVERSAESCVALRYPSFKVYILDDSSDESIKARIDAFAMRHAGRVQVVRRPDRSGMKAGNLNNALRHHAREPYFAIVDADEILPRDFLVKLAPRLELDPACAFVQANHVARSSSESRLARDMGVGVDIHWRWYQPLRNKYGFVMFLGHGALLRRSCWERVSGFPEIVSEDLAYAIAVRERGFHGFFAEDVVCVEEFPSSVRAFRIRHAKWTRGTCEFLVKWTGRLLRARRITIAEKLDILFPTLNLPLTFFYFLFMVNAQFLFPFVFGQVQTLTLELGFTAVELPVLAMKPEMNTIFSADFFAMTLITILAPMLCFVVALCRQPMRMVRFLAHSTALYSALSPLTFVSVLGYAVTRKARFLVTGDERGNGATRFAERGCAARWRRLWAETHPDSIAIGSIEVAAGLVFATAAIAGLQIGFLGLAVAFVLMPIMHRVGWESPVIRAVVWVPFTLTLLGVLLGSASVVGLQPVFFGFGFHF
jgi:cellulose synthase/poly-beta-1,6-N-acetylglucosamine synthase-like glycosyltransferase